MSTTGLKQERVWPGKAPTAAGERQPGKNDKGFERGEALISAEELKQRIDAGDPRLVLLAVVTPIREGWMEFTYYGARLNTCK